MRSSDFLFRLIKSMTKGDRRNFKLFARLQEGDKKYVQLFDAIDRQNEYNEAELLEQFKGERFTRQFSVAKNYLYNYILKTLHVFHKDPYSGLGTLMHQIQILIGKNLYDQAAKLVRKAKHIAERQEMFQELLTLLAYERTILHRTNQLKQFEALLQTLQEVEGKTIAQLANLNDFNLLYDEIYVLMNKSISARRKKERTDVNEILANPLLADESLAISVRAKLKRLDILNDCYMFKTDYVSCLKYSSEIIAIYEKYPDIRKEKNMRYINTVSNLGVFYYYFGDPSASLAMLNKLKMLETFTEQEQLRVFEKYYHVKIAQCIEVGDYQEGLSTIESFVKEFAAVEGKITKSVELAIYYLGAYFYVLAGNPSESLTWINRILNEPKTELRTDIQCMARILNLFIHYELDNRDFIEYNLKSTTRFLANRDRMFGYERLVLKYLRQLANVHPDEDSRGILVKFRSEVEGLKGDPQEREALNMFDVSSWIDSRLQGCTVFEVLKQKQKASSSVKK